MCARLFFFIRLAIPILLAARLHGAGAELILHHGKIVTVNKEFLIADAIALAGGRIVFVGSNDEALKLKQASTELVDLQGKMVLPGLIDSHTHPTGASMIEFDHPIPDMESIGDVLD